MLAIAFGILLAIAIVFGVCVFLDAWDEPSAPLRAAPWDWTDALAAVAVVSFFALIALR
jgi:hypothetical protein